MSTSYEIRQHAASSRLRDFVRAGHEVFRDDPSWVAPLDLELMARLSPRMNPFYKRGEATFFTAHQSGRIVGRCSAQIDHEHQRLHGDGAGFFGFFDTIDDVGVAHGLLDAAAGWLRARGAKKMMGPFSLYANEEIGLLVEGFEHPPVMLMAHSRSYQGALCEQCGLEKEKDLLAYRFDKRPMPRRALKAWEDVRAMPEVKLRSVSLANLAREVELIMDVYNDAWAGKWGFVPALPDEVRKLGSELRLVIDPDMAFIAEVDGETAGVCVVLPNLNEALAGLNGKLLPLGLFKVLYRMKVKHPVSARLMILGIKEKFRKQRRYGGLSAAMYVETAQRAYAKGYQWGELSWTREDDHPINSGIRLMGAHVYKRYRVYRKPL